MLRLLSEFCKDESGAAGTEWAFVASILVLGSVVGLLAVRAEMFGNIQEIPDVRSGETVGR